MKRTKLADRTLPNYTHKEEMANTVSHIVGAALGILALALCPLAALRHSGAIGVVGGVIFGCSLVLLYSISSIYHGLPRKLFCKRIFQVLDHCTIFVLIAGSYTPILLCVLLPQDRALAVRMMIFIWTMTVVGILLNAIDLKRFAAFSMCCYLGMGWCIIVKGALMMQLLGKAGFVLLVSGGIMYSLGAVFYGLGRTKPYRHTVFHLLTVAGSLLHLICILCFVL